MDEWITQGVAKGGFPTIHVVSDSLGKTGTDIAMAVAALFGNMNPAVEIYSEAKDAGVLRAELEEHLNLHHGIYGKQTFVVFYTLVEPSLRAAMKAFLSEHDDVAGVDLLDSAIDALRLATGMQPSGHPGAFRAVNEEYFKRIEAMEFTIAHDDGANPQDLPNADIVLIGVSRSSKTPLSIYLSQLGYRVANVPLDPQTEPPKEIYDVPTSRLFGLMTSPDILVDIRKRRLGKGQAQSAAKSYADYENVCVDLEKSRELMRRLGCIVVHTDNKAIEESAQEILRYYSAFNKTRALNS